MTAYEQLEKRFHYISALEKATGVLYWDLRTIMPEGGSGDRAEQLSTLEMIHHDMITASKVGDLLDAAEENKDHLNKWQLANLREMRFIWRQNKALNSDLVERLSRVTSQCTEIWNTARPNNDFKAVLPVMKELLTLVREQAAVTSEFMGCNLYDALLSSYEPGLSTQRIDEVFDDYAAFLPEFLDQVMGAQAALPAVVPMEGTYSIALQESVIREIIPIVGFDFHNGRLDTSLHPFCGGTPNDIRITTRYREDEFVQAMAASLHETGHAMYEKGLPSEWGLQPVGTARGMVAHESQSLLVENQVGISRECISFLAPKYRKTLGLSGAAYTDENIHAVLNRVQPDFIRVEADEVTYPAHVILRYRLERAMIEGRMELEDLPSAWNDGFEALLGIRPPNDRLGCLQDIHWYSGSWGYFPTYSLGAMAAAQIFDSAKRANPEIMSQIGQGNFAPLMGWLKDTMHSQASLMSTTDELLTHVTGSPLDVSFFKSHLKARYLGQ